MPNEFSLGHASDCWKERVGGRGDFGLGWLVRVIYLVLGFGSVYYSGMVE